MPTARAGLAACASESDCSALTKADLVTITLPTGGIAFAKEQTVMRIASTCTGDFYRVRLSGPAEIAAQVAELGGGEYAATFMAVETGVYTIKATLEYTRCGGHTGLPEAGSTPRATHAVVTQVPQSLHVVARAPMAESIDCRVNSSMQRSRRAGRWVRVPSASSLDVRHHMRRQQASMALCATECMHGRHGPMDDAAYARVLELSWHPVGCTYHWHSPEEVMLLLRHTPVLLVGDSLMRQSYEQILCAMRHGEAMLHRRAREARRGEPFYRAPSGYHSWARERLLKVEAASGMFQPPSNINLDDCRSVNVARVPLPAHAGGGEARIGFLFTPCLELAMLPEIPDDIYVPYLSAALNASRPRVLLLNHGLHTLKVPRHPFAHWLAPQQVSQACSFTYHPHAVSDLPILCPELSAPFNPSLL